MPKKVFAPGNRWLVAYLAFLSAFAPLSTDMYLPALPHMTQALQTTDALSSLSISCFLLLFGASMLFWGPLSDKYGRKPVLYTGALLYVVPSLFLALAQSIWPLLFWRAVQAIGSGGISAMALAIVKDMLRGRAMEKVITWIQTITILAPMLAPVIGGALLAVTDWRGIFACLLLCGLLAGAGTLLLRETMHHPVQGNAFRTLGRLLVVLRHRGFRCLLLLFSATSMPFMAYLALSSYIFQGLFGLSPQAYSLFFAFNAGMSMLGPLAHERFFRTAPRRLFFSAYLGIVVVAGLGLLLVGDRGPFIFALLCAPIVFAAAPCAPGHGAHAQPDAQRYRQPDGPHQQRRPAVRQPVHAALRPARLARPRGGPGPHGHPGGSGLPAGLAVAGQPQGLRRLIAALFPGTPKKSRQGIFPHLPRQSFGAAVTLFVPWRRVLFSMLATSLPVRGCRRLLLPGPIAFGRRKMDTSGFPL